MTTWITPREAQGLFEYAWVVCKDKPVQPPVFVIVGNHAYWKADIERWQFMDGLSFRVCKNESPDGWEEAVAEMDRLWEQFEKECPPR